MGTPQTLTREAEEAILSADILFGAKRILQSAAQLQALCGGRAVLMVEEYSADKIAAYLKEHPGYQKIAVLLSGDVGFYSGAQGILQAFPEEEVRCCCGISSIVYFASRIPTAWQDAKLVSAHGKTLALLNYVNRYPKLMLLVSGKEDVKRLCAQLCEAGLQQVKVTVGSNLSYPEETIRSGRPEDFLHFETDGLHVMMLENPDACHIVTPGIPDRAFLRGKVPMTKEEIRILSLAKLRLTGDACVYDIGAGTGSVSAEAARLCTAGIVYAIERNPEGIALIKENSRRFCLSNLLVVEGTAPEALQDLPAPTHAFLGGSGGSMRRILLLLLEKNPDVRVVINTVTLESLTEAVTLLGELHRSDAEIVQISAARANALGRYHLMMGQNPVYLISFGGKPEPSGDQKEN